MRYMGWMAVLALVAASLMATEEPSNPLAGVVKNIDGEDVNLADFGGKVLLVVNVASRCGHTKQYKQLQELHEKYAERGLVVLGFPCNQFGGQEPGTEAEIKEFCESNYSVSFPLFSKIEVNGDNALSLYKYLTSDEVPIEDRGPIKWNFEKFLLGRDGTVLARFRSRVSPDAPQVVEAIEDALGAKHEEEDAKETDDGAKGVGSPVSVE